MDVGLSCLSSTRGKQEADLRGGADDDKGSLEKIREDGFTGTQGVSLTREEVEKSDLDAVVLQMSVLLSAMTEAVNVANRTNEKVGDKPK